MIKNEVRYLCKSLVGQSLENCICKILWKGFIFIDEQNSEMRVNMNEANVTRKVIFSFCSESN